MQLLVLLTLLAVLPGALLIVTGFTRILIVLGFVRTALGHADHAARTRCSSGSRSSSRCS